MRNGPISMARAAGAGQARIDSVDVAQLLHDIGEASASTNPVELFGMCLGAQRVLAQVHDGAADTLAPDEAAMLAAYRAMRAVNRSIVLDFSRAMAEPAPTWRPALTLVHSLQRGGMR